MKRKCIIFVEASETGAGEIACAYAKDIGLTVVLMSGEPHHYPGAILNHCDIAIAVDTTSATALHRRVAELALDYGIAGIATTSDFHVVQAALLAARIGLPGNPAKVVDTIKNKFKMREAIARIAPTLNPAFALVHRIDEAERFTETVGFPVVAKPLTGNDSLYVKRIDDVQALRAYFNERGRWGRDLSGQEFAPGVLIEQAICGTEYCLDLLRAFGDELVPVGAFKKKITGEDIGSFIKIGACFPADECEAKRLIDEICPVVDTLGFKIGAINIDCKIVDGQVKILEMNPRLVGDQMGSHMIEISTGQNPAHAIVDIACGFPFRWRPTRSRGVAIHRLTMPRAGYFHGIENAGDLKRREGVEAVNELGVKGRWIETAQSNQGVIGSIIVSHTSASEAMELATRLAADAEIRVSSTQTSAASLGARTL